MYFLVNSSPQQLDIATSNFAGAYVGDMTVWPWSRGKGQR